MDITITTPALLFPAISVLFLAYANRYLAIVKRTRELKWTLMCQHFSGQKIMQLLATFRNQQVTYNH